MSKRDIFLAAVGTLLLVSQVFIQAKDGDVSAIITLAGLGLLGFPVWGIIRKNGNGGGKG